MKYGMRVTPRLSVCLQDKAALLATMEPAAVSRLLACMDPHEAVMLLGALGDSSSTVVCGHLSSEERDRLVEVRLLWVVVAVCGGPVNI